MSHSKENLVLHLKLDEIIEDGSQKKVIDDSDKAHDCQVKGNLKVVQDEVFGRCISFDGNGVNPGQIEVPDSPDLQISGNLTVEAWVYITKENFGWGRIVGKGTSTKENYGLFYQTGRGGSGLFNINALTDSGSEVSLSPGRRAGPLELNMWYHFTGVLDQTNNQTYFYLDEIQVSSHGQRVDTQTNRSGTPITTNDSLTIGSTDNPGIAAHTGKIAHVRIYNKALSPEEIQQDMEEDLRAIASFDRTESLVLNLKLDEIIEERDERKVSDALTGSKYNVKGNPEIVIDDKLGGCLSFDGEGDYVELIEADQLSLQNSSFTVEAWINIEDLSIDNQSILGNDETSTNNSLHLIIRQKKPYLGFFGNDTSGNTELAENNWYHITWRYDKSSQEQAMFVDGVLDNSSTGHAPFQGNGIVRIGRWASGYYFKGKIAHVRIYNRALFPEEIKQDMDDDLSAIASFNKTYLLDFNLYEGEDKEPVIFIDNGTRGQELTLEIFNHSDRPISFPPLSGEVSATNHHFELRFRPDTLSRKSLEELVLAEKKDWSMSSPVTQDGMVSLYFLATNNQALGAKETIPFTLQHINGAAAGGARTTRVELRCPQFTYHDELFQHYYREKRLSIINHRGKNHIPLHVGFVGPNRILNDWNLDKKAGSTNELILRITNVLKDKKIDLTPKSKGNAPSKLIISFDVNNDWALGTKSEVESIDIEYEGKEIKPSDQGESPEWIIDFDEETAIEAGQHHELVLSGIISSLPSGHANLYLRYENIPGYWDGTFVCTIEKSPILYKEGNVGIGTTTPHAKLSINGGLHVGGDSDPGDNNLLVDGTTTTNQLVVNETTTTNQLVVNETTTTNQLVVNETTTTNQLVVNETTTTNQLVVNETTTTNQLSVTGSLNFGSSTKQMINLWDNQFGIGIQSNTQYFRTAGNFAWYVGGNHDDNQLQPGNHGTLQMVINSVGNVGIGTENPGAKLEVNGVVRAKTLESTNPYRHRMYPANPEVYQDIFDAKNSGSILKLGNPTYDEETYKTTEWWDRHIIKYGSSHEEDGNGAEVIIPEGYDTVWVRVLGDRWNVIKAYFPDSSKNFALWAGGYRQANCYCPDGSLTDSYKGLHQWLPIPAGQAGRFALIPQTNTNGEFWLSGLAFSKNPWSHAAQSAVAYFWASNGGDATSWNSENWNSDVLGKIDPKTQLTLKVPVVPSGRDKLLYLIEHNNNWNGCMHSGISVNDQPIERFIATYDNPFSRHWNSKSYNRYIAARIPADLIPDNAKHLEVIIDMSKQDDGIHFREIGTHDLEVPIHEG